MAYEDILKQLGTGLVGQNSYSGQYGTWMKEGDPTSGYSGVWKPGYVRYVSQGGTTTSPPPPTSISGGSSTGTSISDAEMLNAAKKELLKKQIELAQRQMAELQNQIAEKEAMGEDASEEKDEMKEIYEQVAKQYEYPWTEQTPYTYKTELAELEGEYKKATTRTEEDYNYEMGLLHDQKNQIYTDYQNYLKDIETGKLRVGEDKERELARALQQKTMFLQQHEAEVKQGRETLNRQWIAKGGLFSGARMEGVGEFQSEADRAKQEYMSSYEYGTENLQTEAERAMQDYTTQQQRTGEGYNVAMQQYQQQAQRYDQLKGRTMEDIARERLTSTRNLQKEYQDIIQNQVERLKWEQYGK